jgi:hypothetical protein
MDISKPRTGVALRYALRASFTRTGRVFISILEAGGIVRHAFGMAAGGPLPKLMPS